MNSTVKSDLVGKIARALERARLGQGKDASILLALSGGPDSVALLHALRTLAPRFGYRLAAAHLNHRLRGAESDRDETFVRELCSTLGVELVAERTDDLDPAASNLEERSREVRYAFLAAAAARLGATHVATAHHADDQAETVMLRLLRGAGAAGLSAMAESVTPAAGSTTILRPMLSVWRHEILRYLDSIGARHVSDSSNAHQGFLRNRVRMELLPALERDFAPGLRRRLAALAMEMRDLDDYVARAARAELGSRLGGSVPAGADSSGREAARFHLNPDGFALNLDGFAALHPALAAALLREFLACRIGSLRRLTRRHIDAMHQLCLSESPSAALDLPGGWRVKRRYAALLLERRVAGAKRYRQIDDRPLAVTPKRFDVPLAREGLTRVPQMDFVFFRRSCRRTRRRCRLIFTRPVSTPTAPPRDWPSAPLYRATGCLRSAWKARASCRTSLWTISLSGARRTDVSVVTLEGQAAWLPGLARGRIALVTRETIRVLRLHAFSQAVLT